MMNKGSTSLCLLVVIRGRHLWFTQEEAGSAARKVHLRYLPVGYGGDTFSEVFKEQLIRTLSGRLLVPGCSAAPLSLVVIQSYGGYEGSLLVSKSTLTSESFLCPMFLYPEG